jgi:hypothetical protein
MGFTLNYINKMDIWIITDWSYGNRPMIVASSKEKAIQQLFDYIGYEGKDTEDVMYHGFKEHEYNDEDNQRSLIGTFTFETWVYTLKVPKQYEKDEYHFYELILDEDQKIIPFDLTKNKT